MKPSGVVGDFSAGSWVLSISLRTCHTKCSQTRLVSTRITHSVHLRLPHALSFSCCIWTLRAGSQGFCSKQNFKLSVASLVVYATHLSCWRHVSLLPKSGCGPLTDWSWCQHQSAAVAEIRQRPKADSINSNTHLDYDTCSSSSLYFDSEDSTSISFLRLKATCCSNNDAQNNDFHPIEAVVHLELRRVFI